MCSLPIIDVPATGRRIEELRIAAGLSVLQVQKALGFSAPQSVYKWQRGESLPTLDNIVMLAALFHVTVDDILVCRSGVLYREPDREVNVSQFTEERAKYNAV